MIDRPAPGVVRTLAEARVRGFLGPGSLDDHVAQAAVLAETYPADWPGRVLDLGSGAGVPGLLLALAWPSTTWTLLDAHRRRLAFAHEAARELDLADRVAILVARAEEAGRSPLRGTFDAVVARGFGPPAVTAECGAPFLRLGGVLWVSEPPEDRPRWPADGLAAVGLVDEGALAGERGRWRRLVRVGAVPEAYPRRVGVPAKRPLF